MDGEAIRRRTIKLLAEALEYPRSGLAEVVRECAALLAEDNLEAAACLREFCAFVEETSPGRLEEVYTGTFDLDAACYPYVGYHLFGESYKRSVFMLQLNERYQAHGFALAGELPDHLAVLLRFLAVCDDPALSEEIVHEALLPALERMDGKGQIGDALDISDRPQDRPRQGYWLVLQALRMVLRQFPANNLQPKAAPLSTADTEESAKKISLKTRWSQHSLRRIKAIFGGVARRKASDLRGKRQWWLQAESDGGNGYA